MKYCVIKETESIEYNDNDQISSVWHEFSCSCCGYKYDNGCDYCEANCGEKIRTYCPNCGAKIIDELYKCSTNELTQYEHVRKIHPGRYYSIIKEYNATGKSVLQITRDNGSEELTEKQVLDGLLLNYDYLASFYNDVQRGLERNEIIQLPIPVGKAVWFLRKGSFNDRYFKPISTTISEWYIEQGAIRFRLACNGVYRTAVSAIGKTVFESYNDALSAYNKYKNIKD